ncbi:formate dehydrogenase accessory sulfurtransferase FdhD [Urechidicola croceus]|uniref:Formate dehydrogenase family accessory protein FdhD n=1 Tax=Urechidicola croceus TaxID=1850246 RepID=A0A1D8P674_9FLAO|nr:formate dehydrogenase accessory sulfurtransferase FdhD [Urechidicola croceus]AOW20070.1 formate dehydrogenase family accessory protein FdhD [Urechidicola croceus]
MQSSKYEAIKSSINKNSKVLDSVVIEAPLQININSESYTVVMRTPGDDTELIRGLLYAEDIYKENEDIAIEIIENTENHFTVINVSIPKHKLSNGYMNKRTLLSVSSCGICGKKELSDIEVKGIKLKSSQNFTTNDLKHMFEELKKYQNLFSETGASHASALFDEHFSLLTIKEDIGRHNTVDKVIGSLLNQNKLNQSKFLIVSGRVSYEIVTKAFIAKIPTIIAVSGCSSLAIDFSKELGLNLIGFVRNSFYTTYN